jgi:hypothetical protein
MNKIIQESFQEISDWSSKTGLYPISDPVLTCDYITSITSGDINAMSLDEIEELMLKVSSYNVYLKSQKASTEAQIYIIENELNRILYFEISNLGPEFKFKSLNEKDSIVQITHPEISDLKRKLSLLKAKLFRIKDVPFAIDKKLELIKLKYQRKRDGAKLG